MNEAAKQRRFERMREKVVCWCKDYWRPYHGSTRHVEEDDGNQMIEKKKSGGHMPLNAAVMDTWKEGKLSDSRRLFGRVLAELGLHDRVAFAEIQDLFGRYGAGDSDYDELREGAARDREAGRRHYAQSCSVRRHLRLLTVNRGIDAMTEALISWGISDRDFWADFGLNAVPTQRTVTTEEQYRRYYLHFVAECERLQREGNKRYRNKALQATADHFEVAKSTVQLAVEQFESGYIRLEAS